MALILNGRVEFVARSIYILCDLSKVLEIRTFDLFQTV